MEHNARRKSRPITANPATGWTMKWLLILLFAVGFAEARADAPECNSTEFAAAAKRLPTAAIRRMQSHLREFYQDSDSYRSHNPRRNLRDGVIGPVTLDWLRRFCTDFSIEPGQARTAGGYLREVNVVLAHFAEIARAYPGWRSVLFNPEFEAWIADQPQAARRELYRLRRSGSAQQILWLLRAFGQPEAGGSAIDYRISWAIRKDAIATLQGDRKLVQKLKGFEGRSWPDRDRFWAAVRQKLDKEVPNMDHYEKLVRSSVVNLTTYQLTDKSFERLKMQSLPDSVLNPLQKLKDLPFPQMDFLETAIYLRFQEIEDLQEEAATDGGQSAVDGSKFGTPGESIGNDARIIQRAVVELKLLRDRMGDFSGFPVEDLQSLNESEMNEILASAEQVTTVALEKGSLDAISKGLSDSGVSPDLMTALDSLVGIEFPSKQLFIDALRAAGGNVSGNRGVEALNKIIGLVEHRHKAYPLQPVSWSGGDCGCVRDDLSGVVYGFYPYWMANGQSQVIDFSIFSRIGYYAVSFDDRGQLVQAGHWSNLEGGFINVARRHRTDVDLVVFKSWQVFENNARNNPGYRDRVTATLVNAVSRKLTNSLFNLAKPFLSLGFSSTPMIGDGITLHFDGLPATREAADLYIRFIQQLRTALRSTNAGLKLNLILPAEAFSGNSLMQYVMARLIPQVGQQDERYLAQDSVDLVLVFLAEPTSSSKKHLRAVVESMFSGDGSAADVRALRRRNLLRKIVPVATPGVGSTAQLGGDIAYFEDNFAGLGFWPLPMTTAGGTAVPGSADPAVISQQILQGYTTAANRERNSGNPLVASARSLYQSARDFVCLYRWVIRALLDVSVFVLIAFGYYYYFRCQRGCFRCLLFVIATPVVLLLTLLLLDSAYGNLARGNTILILLVVLNFLYGVYRYHQKKQVPP